MSQIAILMYPGDLKRCGFCNENTEDGAQLIALVKIAGDRASTTTTIFCSLPCFYRFCKNMIESVSAASSEASVH